MPCKSKTGIEVMSVNLLLEDVTAPVVWRGYHCRYSKTILV